ncbi:hypothetical protein [Streptosporangium sandarakinum]
MPDNAFYSDRVGQSRPRTSEEITAAAWRGIAGLIQRRLDDGSLARAFPEYNCPDDPGRHTITGTDRNHFLHTLEANVPQLAEPYSAPDDAWDTPSGAYLPLDPDRMPDTTTALDVIDFVARHIDQPTFTDSHTWRFAHVHYSFDTRERDPFIDGPPPGQVQFQDDVEQILKRNGIAFTLGSDMRVHRLGPTEARTAISDFRPNTGDPELDALLTDAVSRFLSRVPADRQDALEKLWDAFERLKTLELGGQKSNSIARLLDNAAPGPFRSDLEKEFKALTDIGNRFRIRHHEHDQHTLPNDAAKDYMFIRCVSLIAHVLRRTGRMHQT